MQRAKVSFETVSGEEKLFAEAAGVWSKDERGGFFLFTMGNAEYTISFYKVPQLECRGEISYRLIFDESKITQACLVTEFGEIPVSVKTDESNLVIRGREWKYSVKYRLLFTEYEQEHRLVFIGLQEDPEQ